MKNHKAASCICCICKNKRHEPKSEEHKRKIGLGMLGKNVGNYGRPKPPGFSATMSKILTSLWQNPEYKKKQLEAIKAMHARKVKPNKPEKFLADLLQKLFSNQWKYVGNFEEWIGGKNPDFISVNGQKKIIELFGDYWHGEERTGILNEQHEQERIDVFAKEGYQTLVIWQHELEDFDSLVEKIMDFHNI